MSWQDKYEPRLLNGWSFIDMVELDENTIAVKVKDELGACWRLSDCSCLVPKKRPRPWRCGDVIPQPIAYLKHKASGYQSKVVGITTSPPGFMVEPGHIGGDCMVNMGHAAENYLYSATDGSDIGRSFHWKTCGVME